ncbi:hypothetical protein HN937_16995 [Candidatus Poribacteria bacterium]|jgi:hypothetical protein|nr:hypothetical protein [Candidatus Poribacteria bacterium]
MNSTTTKPSWNDKGRRFFVAYLAAPKGDLLEARATFGRAARRALGIRTLDVEPFFVQYQRIGSDGCEYGPRMTATLTTDEATRLEAELVTEAAAAGFDGVPFDCYHD